MHIIGFFIFFGLIILIISIAILAKVIHFFSVAIHSILHPFSSTQKRQTANKADTFTSNTASSSSEVKNKTKYFDHNDGEYVEFEEIKDESPQP